MSREHYPVLWIGHTAVITLPAEIDITNADQVREDLLLVLNQGAVLLIADLSETTFCDSAGLSALVRSFRRAEASGSLMCLVVSTSPVQRVLTLTGVDRVLGIFPNVTAALAARTGSAAPGDRTFGGNAAETADTGGGAA
jgi:anti-sigma B factor antagonist